MTNRIKVKICGQTSLADAGMSIRLGADFIGVVYKVPSSPRSLDMAAAEPIFREHGGQAFLLTCDMPQDQLEEAAMRLDPYALQLTGNETPEALSAIKDSMGGIVFKTLHLPPAGSGEPCDPADILATMKLYADAGADGFVLDVSADGKSGGTGAQSDWALAAKITAEAPCPVFIAGGISPENVLEAAALPGVMGIDLASGVESAKGVKSGEKLAALFGRLRGSKS